jgi:hypothetical protein
LQKSSNSQSLLKLFENHRTAQTQLLACIYLLGEGYELFRNVSPHGMADIVACKGDEVLRIDVKSGRGAKLTPEQEEEGIIILHVDILHVDENGHCEFDTDRKQRLAEVARATLAEVDGMSPKDGAAHLNHRGITTPNGAQWSPGTIVTMRQRLAV